MKVNFKITKGNNKQTKSNINEKHWVQQKNISNNISPYRQTHLKPSFCVRCVLPAQHE